MGKLFKIANRDVSQSVQDQFGRDLLDRVFSFIEAGQTIEAILDSGLVERQKTSALLARLAAEKAVVPIDTQQFAGKRSILLVTDSSADLPKEITDANGIAVVPLIVNIDGAILRDGFDIDAARFYRALAASKTFPTTSPPTKDDFHRLFLQHVGEQDILCIFISRKMSRTFETASQTVRANFNAYLRQRRTNEAMDKQYKIEMIDSKQVSLGTGLVVLEAAEKIRAGWTLGQVKEHTERLTEKVQVYFMVDNLDYLARGGRIGKGTALLGNFFGLKPILGMDGGGVDAKSRTLGGRWGQRKLVEYMKEDLAGSNGKIKIGICHADARQKAANVSAMLAAAFPGSEQIISDFGPTVGAHLGPGAVGVAWLPLVD